MSLSGSEQEKLWEALLDAYRDYGRLQQMVRFKLGENLARFGGQGDLESVVFNLIEWADSTGKLERLILGAYERTPENPVIKEFYETIFKQHFILNKQSRIEDFGYWKEEPEDIELQSFIKPPPDWYDVGFLERLIEQAKSVCRIEISSQGITGTGVLIHDKWVLTNYHVFKQEENDNLRENALNSVLKFGCITSNNRTEIHSKSFRVDPQEPIVSASPIQELDYVLLKLENDIINTEGIQPTTWQTNNLLVPKMGINLLQHPEGDSMKLSISCDGITSVYPEKGLVHYVNKTAGGSSGSPCFDETGKLVALHHAQRSKGFGSIREGILFSAIYPQIRKYIT